MKRLKISLSPLDTFFFRDGKPFSSGEQSEAEGIFPPFSSTAYGALRTEYISEHGMTAFTSGKLEKTIGTIESVKNASFRIKGIFLADESHTYFSLPGDIVQTKIVHSKKCDHLYHLYLSERSKIFSNAPLTSLLMCDNQNEKVEYPSNSFMDENDMNAYLLDCSVPHECMKQDDFLKREPKIGIGRNAETLTSKEGLLYRLDMMRFYNKNGKFQLCVEASGISLNNQGILKLGGENKAFVYESAEAESPLDSDEFKAELAERLEQKRQNGKIRFKLCFATPAIGDTGWRIKKIFSSGISCNLITAAIGKYLNIGGWDLVKREPKRMYRAVPAGSVYYCETESEKTTAKDVIDAFHYQNISDQRSEEGFGLVLVGAIQEEV